MPTGCLPRQRGVTPGGGLTCGPFPVRSLSSSRLAVGARSYGADMASLIDNITYLFLHLPELGVKNAMLFGAMLGFLLSIPGTALKALLD